METELWPNIINGCDKLNIPVILANGRLSQSSAKGYKKFSYLVRPMMEQLTWVAAQSGDDALRFAQLGVNKEALSVTGNIKFDLIIDETLRGKSTKLLREWRGPESRSIILAASTHRGEDEIILKAFAQIKIKLGSVLLVLVPRHPERFNQVESLCLSNGMTVGRRSSGSIEPSLDVLLGDTMGELISFFGSCDIAFVGGSLVPTGGHNIIEPAAWGLPILSGPHLFNFTEASELLVRSGGMVICESVQGLADSCVQILKDDELLSKMGASSLRIADENRGALNRLLELVDQAILR
jgi:3-deoxy-D-manno-octulosonic-acid transferase